MCGITGKWHFQGRHADVEAQLKKMADALAHRGPDDEGFFVDGNVGLGHRRLSIIDLSAAGHQPMADGSGKFHIVFNGEIYNFPELRSKLEGEGVRFHSKTDTEVILALYKKFGVDCVKHLRGMFAFAIWDAEKQQLFLARDRLGKKPLKYYFDGKVFIFASELKAILTQSEVKKELDFDAIDEYLTYQYVPHPKTGFMNIFKLPPAHWMLVSADGTVQTKRYWKLDFTHKWDLSEAEWGKKIEHKLQECVQIRLMSDVPLGAHLSGGIDSSLVVAMMAGHMKKPVKTFSIGFREADYNELPFARMVAEKYRTDHREFIVEMDSMDMLDKLVQAYEEPYADSSALPTWHLSKLTREHVTVALNGDGGDENFAGYGRYQAMKIFQLFHRLPFKEPMKMMNRLLYRLSGAKIFQKGYRFLDAYAGKNPLDFYLHIVSYFRQDQKKLIYTDSLAARLQHSRWRSFLEEKFLDAGEANWLDRILSADIQSYLPDDLLVKVDMASMAHSLEVRSPFLDHELLELTAKMPSHLKLHGQNKKYLLKKIAYRYLPRECIDRPKQGFGVPLEHWFRGNWNGMLREKLLRTKFLDIGFRREGIEKMIVDHEAHRQNHAVQMWALLTLSQWLEHYFW